MTENFQSLPFPGDISAYLAKESEAERELSRLFAPEQPLIIFDIGSCEGEDSIRYARRFPNARIYSFEPLPANQALIRENLARYGTTNIELVPIALSDRSGMADLQVSSGYPPTEFAGKKWNYGNKSSSLLAPSTAQPMFGWIEFKHTVAVPCETLDDFCLARGISRIDFIHMDVQGAEHLVLEGAKRLLPRISTIWLEVANHQMYQGQKLRTEMEALMRSKHFSLFVRTIAETRETSLMPPAA